MAWYAIRLGIDATIVMPRSTPLVKVTNTEKLGATIVLEGYGVGEAAAHAADMAEESGSILVHPTTTRR